MHASYLPERRATGRPSSSTGAGHHSARPRSPRTTPVHYSLTADEQEGPFDGCELGSRPWPPLRRLHQRRGAATSATPTRMSPGGAPGPDQHPIIDQSAPPRSSSLRASRRARHDRERSATGGWSATCPREAVPRGAAVYVQLVEAAPTVVAWPREVWFDDLATLKRVHAAWWCRSAAVLRPHTATHPLFPRGASDPVRLAAGVLVADWSLCALG